MVGIGVYLFNVLAGKGDAEEGAERLRSGGSKYWQAQFHDYFFVFERRILLVLFCVCEQETKRGNVLFVSKSATSHAVLSTPSGSTQSTPVATVAI
jgi:hypothetical protein